MFILFNGSFTRYYQASRWLWFKHKGRIFLRVPFCWKQIIRIRLCRCCCCYLDTCLVLFGLSKCRINLLEKYCNIIRSSLYFHHFVTRNWQKIPKVNISTCSTNSNYFRLGLKDVCLTHAHRQWKKEVITNGTLFLCLWIGPVTMSRIFSWLPWLSN